MLMLVDCAVLSVLYLSIIVGDVDASALNRPVLARRKAPDVAPYSEIASLTIKHWIKETTGHVMKLLAYAHESMFKLLPHLLYNSSTQVLIYLEGDFSLVVFHNVAVITINPIRTPRRLCCILMPAVSQDLSQLLWKQTWGWSTKSNALTEAICYI